MRKYFLDKARNLPPFSTMRHCPQNGQVIRFENIFFRYLADSLRICTINTFFSSKKKSDTSGTDRSEHLFAKKNFTHTSELVTAVMEQVMKIGLEILQDVLEKRDMEILAQRDKNRFRCKGLQQTSIKTKMGILNLTRRVYVDKSVTEGVHCVCLLDKDIHIEKIGLMEKALCEQAAELVCMTSYRNAAEILTDNAALSVSAMGIWNIVQALGEKEAQRVERYTELAREKKETGIIDTPILYEENDGVWLKLQGEDRKKYGEDKEMKVGITYDGVTWNAAKTRKELHNKVAYASFEDAKSFKNHKEGLISHCFKGDNIKLRVINGDGAQWIQKNNVNNSLSVLDAYHRNRAIGRCVKNPELAKQLRQFLYAKEIPALLERLETVLNERQTKRKKKVSKNCSVTIRKTKTP